MSAVRQDLKRTESSAAHDAVFTEVSSWEGVTVHEHRFGGAEFRVGRRPLGHLHAAFADLPFPRSIRDELVAAGRARPHHVLPDSGWVTALMRTAAEAEAVIELFRLNYGRAVIARRLDAVALVVES
jgi:Luciferase